MSIKISQRVEKIKPSPTLAMSAKSAQLKAQGVDIVSLAAGEPDFDTPQFIKDAGIKALQDGYTRYTDVAGLPQLRETICDKLQRENNLTYSHENILVSCGGKHSFYNLAQALLDKGDEVIIASPYWVSYPDICLLADANPVILNTGISNGFKITPEQLEAAITTKTKLLVLNSPSNPTGVVYSESDLKDLGEVLAKHPQVLIATDDIYEKIIWSEAPFKNIANACPHLIDRIIVLNGVSKSYAMTGWRIGYAAAPAPLIKAMKKVQSQCTSNPAAVSQMAAMAALSGDQSFLTEWCAAFKQRHDYLVEALNALPGVHCYPGSGAFYLFPDFSAAIASLPGVNDDLALADYLLDKCQVALVPGSAFGTDNHMRVSFATSLELLQEAIARLTTIFKT